MQFACEQHSRVTVVPIHTDGHAQPPHQSTVRRGRKAPHLARLLVSVLAILLFTQCKGEEDAESISDDWTIVAEIENAALLAVHGTSAKDVWMVGADDGKGPVVLHYNGQEWQRHTTGVQGDIWWVRAFDDGVVYMAGSDSIVLRYQNGVFERLQTPGLGKTVLFGIWGMASDDTGCGTFRGKIVNRGFQIWQTRMREAR